MNADDRDLLDRVSAEDLRFAIRFSEQQNARATKRLGVVVLVLLVALAVELALPLLWRL